MKKVCGIFMLMLVTLVLSGVCLADEEYHAREFERVPEHEIEHREMAGHLHQMRIRLAELKKEAEIAKNEGRNEESVELRYQAKMLSREIEEHSGQIKLRRLEEAEEHLERLRHMTEEAEEIVERLRRDVERREVARRRSGREMRLRFMPERFDREHLSEQLGDMGNELKDFLMGHIERIEAVYREHQTGMERMERQMQELLAENKQLRGQLREANLSKRKLERELNKLRETQERMENRRQRQAEQRKEARRKKEAQLQAEEEKVEEPETQEDQQDTKEPDAT